MEQPPKAKSIFDSPRRNSETKRLPAVRKVDRLGKRAGNPEAGTQLCPPLKTKSIDLNSFLTNGRKGLDLQAVRKPWVGNQPRAELLDEFDRSYRHQRIETGLNSSLMQLIPLEDIASGSYDEIETTMSSITEDGGVRKFIIQPGNGTKIPHDAIIFINYIGFCEGNDEPIDSISSRERMSTFDLKSGELIPGLLIAFLSMEVGEISKFLITHEYGYEKLGCPNLIPPMCRLLYVVEMVKFTMELEAKPIFERSYRERFNLDFDEIFACSDELRLCGNVKIKLRKFDDANDRYQRALEILEEAYLLKKEEDVRRNELRYKLYSNMAECYLRLDVPEYAVCACKAALEPEMPPPSAKIFFRYAKALYRLDKLDEAIGFCQKALEMNPVMDVRDFKIKIENGLRAEGKCRDELYKRMMTNVGEDGTSDDLDDLEDTVGL